MARKSNRGQKKIKQVMHEYKKGTLKAGRRKKKVQKRKQAVAIALAQARKSGARIARKKRNK